MLVVILTVSSVTLRELYQQHPNSDTGMVLFRAAQRLCQNLGDDVPMILPERFNLPAFIHQLACQAVAVCGSGLTIAHSLDPSESIYIL